MLLYCIYVQYIYLNKATNRRSWSFFLLRKTSVFENIVDIAKRVLAVAILICGTILNSSIEIDFFYKSDVNQPKFKVIQPNGLRNGFLRRYFRFGRNLEFRRHLWSEFLTTFSYIFSFDICNKIAFNTKIEWRRVFVPHLDQNIRLCL